MEAFSSYFSLGVSIWVTVFSVGVDSSAKGTTPSLPMLMELGRLRGLTSVGNHTVVLVLLPGARSSACGSSAVTVPVTRTLCRWV